jgi:hypothetical protein
MRTACYGPVLRLWNGSVRRPRGALRVLQREPFLLRLSIIPSD